MHGLENVCNRLNDGHRNYDRKNGWDGARFHVAYLHGGPNNVTRDSQCVNDIPNPSPPTVSEHHVFPHPTDIKAPPTNSLRSEEEHHGKSSHKNEIEVHP